MISAKKLALAGVLALAGLALTADKASAQFGYYNYGYNPYVGGVYNNFAYGGVNPYATGLYGTALPYYNYQTRYYSNPFYGTGVYNSYYQSPSLYGPGGFQYNYWRWR